MSRKYEIEVTCNGPAFKGNKMTTCEKATTVNVEPEPDSSIKLPVDEAVDTKVREKGWVVSNGHDFCPKCNPPITMPPETLYESTNLYGSAYDADSHTLQVRFNNGGLYTYFNVPPHIANTFGQEAHMSAGKAFDRLIKKAGFRYRKDA